MNIVATTACSVWCWAAARARSLALCPTIMLEVGIVVVVWGKASHGAFRESVSLNCLAQVRCRDGPMRTFQIEFSKWQLVLNLELTVLSTDCVRYARHLSSGHATCAVSVFHIRVPSREPRSGC